NSGNLSLSPSVTGTSNIFTGATSVYQGGLILNAAGGAAINGDLVIGDGVGTPGSDFVFANLDNQLWHFNEVQTVTFQSAGLPTNATNGSFSLNFNTQSTSLREIQTLSFTA